MLSAKLLSCLAVVSAIVMSSCEAHAEVTDPDEGSKVLTSPSSAISQHDTTRSLRTADAAVAKANEERMLPFPNAAEAVEEELQNPAIVRDILKTAGQAPTDTDLRELYKKYSTLYHDKLQKFEQRRLDFQQSDPELVKKAKELEDALGKVSLSRGDQALVGDFEIVKAAPVIGSKSSPNGKAEESHDLLVLDLLKTKAEIAINRYLYRSTVEPMEEKLHQLKGLLENGFNKQVGEGPVRDISKSEAVAPNDHIDHGNHPPQIGEETEATDFEEKIQLIRQLLEFLERPKSQNLRLHNQAGEGLVGDVPKSKAAAPSDHMDQGNHPPQIGEETEAIDIKGRIEYYQQWLKHFEERPKSQNLRLHNQAGKGLAEDIDKSKAAVPNDEIDPKNNPSLKRKRTDEDEDEEPVVSEEEIKFFQEFLKRLN